MEPKERQAEIERMKSSFVPFRPVEDLDLILFGEANEKTVLRLRTRKICLSWKLNHLFTSIVNLRNFEFFFVPISSLTQNNEGRMEVDEATSGEISQSSNDIEIWQRKINKQKSCYIFEFFMKQTCKWLFMHSYYKNSYEKENLIKIQYFLIFVVNILLNELTTLIY